MFQTHISSDSSGAAGLSQLTDMLSNAARNSGVAFCVLKSLNILENVGLLARAAVATTDATMHVHTRARANAHAHTHTSEDAL